MKVLCSFTLSVKSGTDLVLIPFEHGNKRTALGVGYLFLRINGYRLILPDTEQLCEILVQVITGEASEPEFIKVVTGFGVAPI